MVLVRGVMEFRGGSLGSYNSEVMLPVNMLNGQCAEAFGCEISPLVEKLLLFAEIVYESLHFFYSFVCWSAQLFFTVG